MSHSPIQVSQGVTSPYWERPIPDAYDLCGRLEALLSRASSLRGNLSTKELPLQNITRKPKIVASLALAIADLDKATPGDNTGQALFSYVTYSFTRKNYTKDLRTPIAYCEKYFSVYLIYPVSAENSGQMAELMLDEIGRIVEAGFTAWSVHRAYPAKVRSPEKVEINENWLATEVEVCVPYNTGYMDSVDFVEQNKGESFKVRMTLDIEGDGVDSDDVKIIDPDDPENPDEVERNREKSTFGTDTITVYALETGSRTPDAPNSSTAFTPIWSETRPSNPAPTETVWESTVTFGNFYDRVNGEVQYDQTTGLPVYRRVFVSATAPKVSS